jgi:hypothetical protein
LCTQFHDCLFRDLDRLIERIPIVLLLLSFCLLLLLGKLLTHPSLPLLVLEDGLLFMLAFLTVETFIQNGCFFI